MRIPFRSSGSKRDLNQPAPADVPKLQSSSLAALYRAARVGGDFYDFVVTPAGRLVFIVTDIAGRREEAFHVAAAAQRVFRDRVEKNFSDEIFNEHDAMTDLLIEVNRAIITAAGGVRNAPSFIGCYEEHLGTLSYINAGHPAGLLKDSTGISELPANGFPLGLFSHAAHDTQLSVLQPGAALLIVSKGLVETKHKHKEFGMERLTQIFSTAVYHDAHDLCTGILDSVDQFMNSGRKAAVAENDITAVALVRAAATMSAGV